MLLQDNRNCHGILDATAAVLTVDMWPLRGCSLQSLSVYVTIMNPLTRLHEYATKGPWQAPAGACFHPTAEEEQEGALAPEGSRERVSASDHAIMHSRVYTKTSKFRRMLHLADETGWPLPLGLRWPGHPLGLRWPWHPLGLRWPWHPLPLRWPWHPLLLRWPGHPLALR